MTERRTLIYESYKALKIIDYTGCIYSNGSERELAGSGTVEILPLMTIRLLP